MNALANELVRLLQDVGPLFLTVLAFLETAFITGLVVPAGVALLLASFLASQGTLALGSVVVAAFIGALAGDSTGFWLARRLGPRVLGHGGVAGTLLAGRRDGLRRLLRLPPLAAVTAARVVAFVRTVMPLAAGTGTMAYPRFLAYDLLGILGWGMLYVGVGYAAGESWQRVGRWVDGGWALVFVVGALIVMRTMRKRRNGSAVKSVALTGNAGSGKSTVADVWRARGVPVVSADELSREVVLPGSEGLRQVVAEFGDGVLADDGTLDREGLRNRVAEDPSARGRLEGVLHPLIAGARADWVRRQTAAGARLVASEIPLLFEAALETEFDVVVSVHAPTPVLRERLTELRGWSAADADGILAAQIPTANTLHLADHVIENVGSRHELESAAVRVLEELGVPADARRNPEVAP